MRILFCTILLTLFIAPAFAGEGGEWKPSFEGSRISDEFWGMATGDIDGDSSGETLLLKRREVLVGRMDGKDFKKVFSCELPGAALGARVYLFDLDGDNRDEIVVAAVEDELPASMAFDIEDGKCSSIFTRERVMLRAAENDSGSKKLFGQSWSTNSFFFGPVCEYGLVKGKLKKGDCLKIPNYVNIYQFASVPAEAGTQFAVVKGHDRLQLYEKVKGGFAREWQSGEKFGGSLNILEASQREIMGEVTSNDVEFDVPPIVSYSGGALSLIAVRHDMPIGSFIGKKPLIRGCELVAFAPDQSFVFKEFRKTMRMPGAVTDALLQELPNGNGRILLLMQAEQGMFTNAQKSFIIGFDLPAASQ